MRRDRDTDEPLVAFGRLLNQEGTPIPSHVDTTTPGDHGADPLGDGNFRMVPSGDIVTYDERCKRLATRRKGT